MRFFTDFPILTSGDEDIISAMDVSKSSTRSCVRIAFRMEKIIQSCSIRAMVEQIRARPINGARKKGLPSTSRFGREQLERAGYRVEMTRANDVGVSLEDASNFANRFPRAVFVSIHFNTSSGGAGVESYALAPAGVVSNASQEGHLADSDNQKNEGNELDAQNMALAAAVHASVLSRISVFDRGVRHARFHVLRNIKIPAVLLEGSCSAIPSKASGSRQRNTGSKWGSR